MPAKAVWGMQSGGDRQPCSHEDPNRSSERSERDRPYAGLEAVERDAGIDQTEQQQHAFDGKTPPALEKRQRIVSRWRRLNKQTWIASRVGKKWNDGRQRECGMNAAQKQGA